MELFRKAGKFLNELDEPARGSSEATSEGGKSLEAHLEGAAARVLSWAAAAPAAPAVAVDSPREGEDVAADDLHAEADAPTVVNSGGDESASRDGVEHAGGCREAVMAGGRPLGDGPEENVVSEMGQTEMVAQMEQRHDDCGEQRPSSEGNALSENIVAPSSILPYLESGAQSEAAVHAETLDVADQLMDQSDAKLPVKAQKMLGKLQAELDDTRDALRQREQKLVELSGQLIERDAAAQVVEEQREAQLSARITAALATAKADADRDAKALRRHLKAAEAARDAALSEAGEWRAEAADAARRLKEDACDTERELREHQENWRKKIVEAERRADEVAKSGGQQMSEVMAERDQARAELSQLRDKVSANADEIAKLKAERSRLTDLTQDASSTEAELRHELLELERGRNQLQEACSQLSSQLESVQAAYSTTTQEMSLMSSRLHELEFGRQMDSGAEDLLRQQHKVTKERCAELDRQLAEVSAMRDHAQQQVQRLQHEVKVAREEAESVTGRGSGTEATNAAETSEEEALRSREELERAEQRHQQELQRCKQMSLDELNYLKQKNDEKDKRIEQLICERNMLRLGPPSTDSEKGLKDDEVTSSSRPSSSSANGKRARADAEDAMLVIPPRTPPAVGAGTSADVHACVADVDMLFRRLSRSLFYSKILRRIFYGYFVVLHLLVWVVLHRTAVLHHPHV